MPSFQEKSEPEGQHVVDPKGFDWERPDQGFDASLLQ
jgi:hypothetical protein